MSISEIPSILYLAPIATCIKKCDLYGREVVLLNEIDRNKWTILGQSRGDFVKISHDFQQLGFVVKASKKTSQKVKLILPEGWRVEREQRYADLFFLTFRDKQTNVRADIRCKTDPQDSYLRVEFDYKVLIQPSILKFDTPLSDVFQVILSFLKKSDLCSTRRVNKSWCIRSSQVLIQPDILKLSNLFDICLKSHHPNCSKNLTMIKIKTKLLTVDPQDLNREGMKQTLIRKKEQFISIISDIAYFDLSDQVKEADLPRTFTLISIDWINLLRNIKDNKQSDRIIISCFADELRDLFKSDLKSLDDLENLLTIVNTLPESACKNIFLIDLHRLMTKNNKIETSKAKVTEGIKRCLNMCNVDSRSDIQSIIQGHIALKIAKIDFERGVMITKSIRDLNIRSQLFQNFSQIVSLSVARAMSVAKSIPMFEMRIQALAAIANKQSGFDLKAFFEKLYAMLDDKDREKGFTTILLNIANHDIDAALALSNEIQPNTLRTKVQAGLNFRKTIRIIQLA